MACPCMTLSVGQIQQYLRQYGFPEDKIVLMSAVLLQESGGRTCAIGTIARGREYSVGVGQINTFVHKVYTIEQLKCVDNNFKEIMRIYRLQGLRAWGGYTDGGYKKYLAKAQQAYNGNTTTVNLPNGTVTLTPNPVPSFSLSNYKWSNLSDTEKIILGFGGVFALLMVTRG